MDRSGSIVRGKKEGDTYYIIPMRGKVFGVLFGATWLGKRR